MQNIQTIETHQLLDLLAKHTSDYTRMMNDNIIGEEYEKCKMIIMAIQTEIDFRKNIADITSTNFTQPPDF